MRSEKEFDELFRQHYSELLHFAHTFINNEDECCDIVSSAFEDLWRRFDTVSVAAYRSFLYSLVRNKCIDYYRHNTIERNYAEFYAIITSEYTDRDSVAEDDERVFLVRRILDSLKPPTKEIFEMCYLQQMKYQEVADELDVSIATIKKHMVRALRIIREKFKKN